MKEAILKNLAEIEANHGVKILLAVDGGSRGYGIAAQDSDYDIRFIFVRSSKDYMRVTDKLPATITERPADNLDFHGWDLGKVACHGQSGSMKLWDMLMAKEAYISNDSFVADAISYCREHIKPVIANAYIRRAEEYLDMADVMQNNVNEVLHACHTLMQGFWFLQKKDIPPTNLSDLADGYQPDLYKSADFLAAQRRVGNGAAFVGSNFISNIRSYVSALRDLLVEGGWKTEPPSTDYNAFIAVNTFFIKWQPLGDM